MDERAVPRSSVLRRSLFWLCLLASPWAAPGCDCGGKQAEQQRKLLAPKDKSVDRKHLLEQRRLLTQEGKLVASDETVAGLTLPRGLALHRAFEHEWYYRAQHRELTLERLEAFFREQLSVLKLERDGIGALIFVDAQLNSDPKAPLLTLRLSPLPGGLERNEVYLRQRRPSVRKQFPSQAEVEAQMKARMQHAE